MAAIPSSQSPSDEKANGRIFTIPPGAPFLRTLAEALLDGTLVAGYRPVDEPLSLTTATVYLPTRRATRAFAGEIAEAAGGSAVLLPAILTLGDDPDDAIGFARQSDPLSNSNALVPEARRRMMLARLVRSWTDQIAQSTRDLYGAEDITIPSSAAEALHMANELGRLLDQFEVEEVDPVKLADLRPENDLLGDSHRWAEWWQLTLQFLAIITKHWPKMQQEAGMVDAARARKLAIDARAAHYREEGTPGPVIVAGTTGSVPATARLVATIAGLPQGAVVLPGVDRGMDAGLFKRLVSTSKEGQQAGLASHPQHSLARLLHQMEILPDAVQQLGTSSQDSRHRAQALSRALLPAQDTAQWMAAQTGEPADFAAMALIEAAHEREEALAIAIALREAIEQPGQVAALVTPDRKLARRVAAELHRFGIEIDDSAGLPLAQSDAGLLIRQLVAVALQPADPVLLAAFAKRVSETADKSDHAVGPGHHFELAVLRNAIIAPEPGEYAAAVVRAHDGLSENGHTTAALLALTDADWQAITGFAEYLDAALEPLSQLGETRNPVPLDDLFARLRQCISALFGGSAEGLCDLAGGEQMLALIEEHAGLDDAGMPLRADELVDTLDALAETQTVRNTVRTHPRLHIWGPLEARLQHADLMVLGGLNEGTWPAVGRNDAFLNRPMRSEIGLSVPEWRIGQAAHDFEQLSGHRRIIYSRSLRSENAPTVASRWLQRLEVTLGEPAFSPIRERGEKYLMLARTIDASKARSGRTVRPAPCPALALRPRRLSVTEIETWIRDPYAIFAKHVLQLLPLPPLRREADALLKGRIYHDIAERYVDGMTSGTADEALFEKVATEVLESAALPGPVAALWLPRLLAVGKPFAEWEAGRREAVSRSLLEAAGSVKVGGTDFVLTGRADRIDFRKDGRIDIIDYKTGISPSARQARTLSPQLALEAMMAGLGGFGEAASGSIGDLLYVRLRPGKLFRVDDVAAAKPATTGAAMAQSAWQSLGQMVLAYQDAGQGYVSRRAPFAESETGGTYDHLARVREWSIGEMDGETGE